MPACSNLWHKMQSLVKWRADSKTVLALLQTEADALDLIAFEVGFKLIVALISLYPIAGNVVAGVVFTDF